MRLEFSQFAVRICTNINECPCSHVKITDGDGTILMDKSCGYATHPTDSSSYFMPPMITTKTNAVDIYHHTDGSGAAAGWSFNWTAVTPGLKPLHSTSTHSLLCDDDEHKKEIIWSVPLLYAFSSLKLELGHSVRMSAQSVPAMAQKNQFFGSNDTC